MNAPDFSKGLASKWWFWILVIVAGAGYGLALYGAFDYLFIHTQNGGVMMASFLFGVPFSTSTLINYFLISKKRGGFFKVLGIIVAVILLTCLGAYFIFGEGTICIVMLLGTILIPTILGALLGGLLGRMKINHTSGKLMSVLAILPLILGSAEMHIDPYQAVHDVRRTVFIAASPEAVWSNIIDAPAIKPEEVKDGFAYKIGGPRPVSAKVVELKVGGIRKSVWERGVNFDEEITAFTKNRYIEWIYHFNENSFPPGSADDHVKVGGRYFDLKNTAYTLRPADGGTYLEISVKYRVSTNFNWYADPLAFLFVANTSDTLLHFYKSRAELSHVRAGL